MATKPTVTPVTTITVMLREIYGNVAYYPVCEGAKTFARISGTKTLTMSALNEIAKLGITIKREHMEPRPPSFDPR